MPTPMIQISDREVCKAWLDERCGGYVEVGGFLAPRVGAKLYVAEPLQTPCDKGMHLVNGCISPGTYTVTGYDDLDSVWWVSLEREDGTVVEARLGNMHGQINWQITMPLPVTARPLAS